VFGVSLGSDYVDEDLLDDGASHLVEPYFNSSIAAANEELARH
jgi:hypothetical protein